MAAAPAQAAGAEVALGCLQLDDDPSAPACGSAHAGVLRLLAESRRRTSVDVAALPQRVGMAEAPPAEPLLLWAYTRAASSDARLRDSGMDARLARRLGEFLAAGGSLLVDVGCGPDATARAATVRQLLQVATGSRALAPVAAKHVLYKTFYLAEPPRGRLAQAAPPEGLFLQGRLAVLLLQHDLFAALGEAGQSDADAATEMDLRWAVNWLMLALCGDYKNDHVHLPYILQRRH